jgi:hypothetical protein
VSVIGTTGREAIVCGQLLAGCPNAAGALRTEFTRYIVAMCRGAYPNSVAGTLQGLYACVADAAGTHRRSDELPVMHAPVVGPQL